MIGNEGNFDFVCGREGIPGVKPRLATSCLKLLHLTDIFNNGGQNARETYTRVGPRRRAIFIKVLSIENWLFYWFVHNVCTTEKHSTPYKRSTKSVASTTKGGDGEREPSSQKEQMVVRKLVSWKQPAVLLSPDSAVLQ